MLDFRTLDKESLRKEFSKDYERYFSVRLFEDEGFVRKECRICRKNFWSIGEKDTCDDPSHTPYTFFREKPRTVGYKEFWGKFSDFFRKNGHEEIERYPVVSRWRQDLYFTIASIQDFQRIENVAMNFEYNVNPLIVPQICLRFSDVENVGVTGRHLTSFMMAGQHSFNYPKEGYWRDMTIELNYKFLTKVLGVRKEDLVYNEDVWAMGDFSEFGPCLESFSNGLELVNSVFTQFESMNGKVKELDAKVVDVGWGFERLIWFYTGFDNLYEAVFHEVIRKLDGRLGFERDRSAFRKFAGLAGELDVTEKGGGAEKESEILRKAGISEKEYREKIKPAQAFYAMLDHARTLLFAIADGALPSNIGGGYNLRVILRRALGFEEEYGIGVGLLELAEIEAEELRGIFPELAENMGTFAKIMEVEKGRYSRTRHNAERMIESIIAKKREIGREEIRTLYESNGITPEFIASVAEKKGVMIAVKEGAYDEIIKGDFIAKAKGPRLGIEIDREIRATEQLYYRLATESRSKVLQSAGKYIVLDKTPFYPEGGGQEADHGTIGGNRVADVQKVGDVIVHILEEVEAKGIRKGAEVECRVDVDRRERLMAHHTATHLMSAAARSIIGRHAWQEGTRKQYSKAHIDIAHYEKLSDSDVDKLEEFVNRAVLNGIKVNVEIMERGKAESEFGFSIYQGHGVPAKRMRMVVIRDLDGNLIDAEACGGTHVAGRESLIGIVKIIDTQRIHDGVDRIEFTAGRAALDYFRREDGELANIAKSMNTEKLGLSEKVARLREDYGNTLKEQSRMKEAIAVSVGSEIAARLKGAGRKEEIIEVDQPRDVLRKAVAEAVGLRKGIVVIAHNKKGELVCISGEESGVSAIAFVRKAFGERFRGGGSEKAAEGILMK